MRRLPCEQFLLFHLQGLYPGRKITAAYLRKYHVGLCGRWTQLLLVNGFSQEAALSVMHMEGNFDRFSEPTGPQGATGLQGAPWPTGVMGRTSKP